jgi:hypothetical protein
MKFITTLLAAFTFFRTFAQQTCVSNHPLFNIPPGKTPTPITTLGANPQIKCLQNITEKDQFFKAIQSCKNNPIYQKDFEELDNLLKDMGFVHGISDQTFSPANLTYDTIPYGSKGMLGYKKNKKIGYEYSILIPEHFKGVPGWRITSPTGCYIYIFTKCGNAFYPELHLCPQPPCPTVTIAIETVSKPLVYHPKPVRKTVITTYLIKYHKPSKEKGGGSSDSITFYSDTLTLDEKEWPDSSYFVYNEAVNQSIKLCSDSTIKIPLALQLGATATSPTISSTPISMERKITIWVNRRGFRKAKKTLKNIVPTSPQPKPKPPQDQ